MRDENVSGTENGFRICSAFIPEAPIIPAFYLSA